MKISSPILDDLVHRFETRTATVGIVGLGYVGLPLLLRFVECGYKVIGFDIDDAKIDALRQHRSYIRHIDVAALASRTDETVRFTSTMADASLADALILCVPTPLDAHREPDMSFVTTTMEALAPHLRAGQVVSLESTTYPGTTEEELRPRIEAAGMRVGSDVFLVYSPEREDPGNRKFDTRSIPKVVSGSTAACLKAGMALYRHAIDTLVPVSSTRAGELTKLLENIHRAVNIGLVNEIKLVADRMGIDIHEVIRAAATKPFGFVPYYPGPGLGGHCIPIDPFYLTWKAREYGVNTRFIELAGEVNSSMPEWVARKVAFALNGVGKPVRGAKLLILGVAYKKNVDDMRETPAAEIIEHLREMGADIEYVDPWIPVFKHMRRHRIELASVELSAERVARSDCVVVVTDHDDFDYAMVHQHAKLIVDSRGVYRESSPKVVRA